MSPPALRRLGEFPAAFHALAAEALGARGRFAWAATGGSSARALYPACALGNYAGVVTFFGDERAVPPEHADSNYKLVREALGDATSLRRIPVELGIDAAAEAYARELVGVLGEPPALDLAHVGMGPDGHVCSLFPGHAGLASQALVLAVRASPKPPPERVSLGMVVLARARALWITVAGAEKAEAVRACIEDPASDLPAARASRAGGDVVWWLDEAAASRLSTGVRA